MASEGASSNNTITFNNIQEHLFFLLDEKRDASKANRGAESSYNPTSWETTAPETAPGGPGIDAGMEGMRGSRCISQLIEM